MPTESVDTFGLLYIDYGNVDSVNTNRMAKLHSSLLHKPLLALKCALYGINRLNPALTWDPKVLKVNEQIHTIKVRANACNYI